MNQNEIHQLAKQLDGLAEYITDYFDDNDNMYYVDVLCEVRADLTELSLELKSKLSSY